MLWIGLPILGFLFLRFAPGDLLFPVLAGLSFVPWAAIPFFIFLWLLGRIVRAVERRD
jgi:hypothetical protein